jgi:fatty-acyl-CoA synthase
MTAPLSHAFGETDPPLLEVTIGEQFRRAVEHCPEREFLVLRSQSVRLTYLEVWNFADRLARSLLARGVRAGDRVGIWSPNRYEWIVVQYATARIGAILVNINPAYRAEELRYALVQSGVSTLFYAKQFRQTEYEPMLRAVRGECPELKTCVNLDDGWSSYLRHGDETSTAELDRVENALSHLDAINIQYTSGTTGFPKGATLSHRNIINNAASAAYMLRYTENDRVCVPVPFYHCFGMVFGSLACMCRGACMVVPGESFQTTTTLEAIQEERCTSLYGVPTMFRAVLEDPLFSSFDVSSLRTGIMAGAPCPIELMREVVTTLHMPEVAIGYGMTETSPTSTFTRHDDPLERRVGSVGRAQPHVEISIQDPASGRILPRGEEGEFCARGYHVMRGYWNDPEATARAIDSQGWMHSGDLASMEIDGYVRITGRLKDVIIRGGENISPREIESVLERHGSVSEAQVIGVPSRKYGEEVMAWVKLKPGCAGTEAEMLAFCKERMAGYKVPKFWRFTEAFPMTVTGKIQKFKLREMAMEALKLEEEETA